jgi:hypothetical protein
MISGLVLRGDFIMPVVLIYISISCIALISGLDAHTLDLLFFGFDFNFFFFFFPLVEQAVFHSSLTYG